MYGFDFDLKEKNDVSLLIQVNDDYVSVEYDNDEVDYMIVGYDDDNKLEYKCEVEERWSDEESEYILTKIYNDYLN